eukprot:CAMPEP_0181216486 /NCGR_PEP_ID=MMETSP1096-20121128/26616_1 /TAXON_ID=156174 ORGANISM="Chrysochromulina ericina, Strain CCMP281" /NCGR_SAMPLE_ID=MMETSP1096 /ASSEMBLY_ACC=CAM_ASM_000453 /LENGTH=113 /DNA_ID=CAMNT_0023308499 /DNA_START=363 /DNA_END=703 /DNA_ORIENTATION=+
MTACIASSSERHDFPLVAPPTSGSAAAASIEALETFLATVAPRDKLKHPAQERRCHSEVGDRLGPIPSTIRRQASSAYIKEECAPPQPGSQKAYPYYQTFERGEVGDRDQQPE